MAPDPASAPRLVLDPSGSTAELVTFAEGDDEATLRLGSGQRVRVPAATLHLDGNQFRSTLDFDTLVESGERLVVPLVEEELYVGKRTRETGRVRIAKRVETHEAVVDETLLREEVDVERVPVGRYVDGPVEVRHEGEITIIPVLEEVLVVEKRLLLKEELHVTKRQTEVRETQHVELRKEHVEVERLAPTDDTPEPSAGR